MLRVRTDVYNYEDIADIELHYIKVDETARMSHFFLVYDIVEKGLHHIKIMYNNELCILKYTDIFRVRYNSGVRTEDIMNIMLDILRHFIK